MEVSNNKSVGNVDVSNTKPTPQTPQNKETDKIDNADKVTLSEEAVEKSNTLFHGGGGVYIPPKKNDGS